MRKFRIVLEVDAKQMAEVIIEWGDKVQEVAPVTVVFNGNGNGKEKGHLIRKIEFGKNTMVIATGKKPEGNLSRSLLLALQSGTKVLAGKPKGMKRIDLTNEVKKDFVKDGMNAAGASSSLSTLSRNGYFKAAP